MIFKLVFLILAIVLFLVGLLLVFIGSGVEPRIITALLLGGLASFAASFLPVP